MSLTASLTAFTHCVLFDGVSRELHAGRTVVVEDARIVEVGTGAPPAGAQVVDCHGQTLMPGLIDAHVHIIATEVNLAPLATVQKSFLHAQTRLVLEGMLQRGFTSVRDAGGADSGFVRAIEQGLIDGPRLFIAGAAISQTGGHADMRPAIRHDYACACGQLGSILGRLADGVPAVRQAVRDEIRMGAHQIKVMASGGAASPNDPIENTQYSLEELRAIVEEAEAANTYVMAHAYTPRAIRRAVECGARSIEHGNLLDESSALLMRERGAFLVPTLIASDALVRFGDQFGSPPESMRKIRQVRDRGLEAVRIARRCGTRVGFGTDLLGLPLHGYQGEEFALRAQAEEPFDTLISATSDNAELMLRSGEIGQIRPGALADLLVVDGDPTRDPEILNQQGTSLSVIMKGGVFFKRTLA